MVELIPEQSLLFEEHHVDIPGKRPAGIHLLQVKGNAARDHVALRDVIPGQLEAAGFEILLCLFQVEGAQEDAGRRPVEQSSLVSKQLVGHPRSRASASDKDDVVLGGCPAVPERFQCRYEVGFRSIQPRHLVYEDDFLF